MLTFLTFADGTIREVPERLAPRVVGLDADGDLLVLLLDGEPAHPAPDGSGPYLLPLTPCCSATGKGAATGIVCRRCFNRVDEKYGAWSHLAVAVVRHAAALALDLFARVKELEHSDTNLPGADVVNLLVAWFAEHGLDIALPAATYAATINVESAAAEPHCSHDPAALRVVAMLRCECGELINPASGG